jgi:hypothetical protein
MSAAPIDARKMSEWRQMNALIFENAQEVSLI